MLCLLLFLFHFPDVLIKNHKYANFSWYLIRLQGKSRQQFEYQLCYKSALLPINASFSVLVHGFLSVNLFCCDRLKVDYLDKHCRRVLYLSNVSDAMYGICMHFCEKVSTDSLKSS